MKKLTAIILCITMLFGVGSISAFADTVQNPELAASVESVDIPDIEKYLIVEKCYNETYPAVFGETPVEVTVNFKDGTSQVILYDCNNEPASREILFLNGETAVLWIYYNLDERVGGTGKYYLVVDIGEENLKEYECTVTDASFASNFEELALHVKVYINFIVMHVESIAEKAALIKSSEDILSIMEDVEECFRFVRYIFENIIACVADTIK